MKVKRLAIEELIQIQRDDDVIIVNPLTRAWYYTTIEGWKILKMVNKGMRIKEIEQRTSVTTEKIQLFIKDIERVLFNSIKKTSKELSASIFLTKDCNMNCKHCRYACGQFQDDLDIKLAKKYIKEVIEEGVISLTITGGEPLTKPELCYEIIKYAYSLKSDLKIQLLTNGSLITSEIAKKLKDLDVRVQVSLDSLDEKKFRDFRGFPLSLVLRGIKNLLKEKMKVTISMVLTRLNANEIEKVISFGIKQGITGIHFPFLEKGGRGKENWEDLALSDAKMISVLSKLLTMYFDEKIRDEISFPDFDSVVTRIVYPSLANACKCGHETSTLYPDGTIYPCTNLTGDSRYCLGSISEISLAEIRNSTFVKQLPTINDIEKCKTCEVRWLCLGGCKDRVNLFYGDFHHQDPYCKVLKWWLKKMLFKTADLMEQKMLKLDR